MRTLMWVAITASQIAATVGVSVPSQTSRPESTAAVRPVAIIGRSPLP